MNSLDVDILYDYLVTGDSQQMIADRYNLTQREISNILTKNYGVNKGNVAWGTGSANQKGKYSNLSYDDICDFVNSGCDFDEWLDDNDDDFYEDEDYYDDIEENNNFDNRRYGDTRPIQDYRPRKKHTGGGYSFSLIDLLNSRFGGILFLGFIAALLSILVKVKAIIQVFPDYLKLLWDGNYVFMMVGLAFVNIFVRAIINHEPIGQIFDEPRVYYWLGAGFVLAGVKLLFDMGFAIIWPGALPIALGLGIIIFVKWLDNH